MNYRSPLFAFALGIAFGGALGAASVVHGVTVQCKRRLASLTETWDRQLKDADRLTGQCRDKLGETEDRAMEYERAGQAMQQDLHERDAHDQFFTLVYEPQPEFAPSEQGQALAQILNLYRPGLGTVLARLQTPPQPGMQLRMVLRGYVHAEQLPPGVHLVYTLNPDAVSGSQAVQ